MFFPRKATSRSVSQSMSHALASPASCLSPSSLQQDRGGAKGVQLSISEEREFPKKRRRMCLGTEAIATTTLIRFVTPDISVLEVATSTKTLC